MDEPSPLAGFDWDTIIASTIAGVLLLWGTITTARASNRGRPENALIERLQQQQARTDTRVRELEEAFAQQERLRLEERRRHHEETRIRDDYINMLRHHISLGNPPPPPPWPSQLVGN